mgnify:CR=1 FL=1
MGSGHKGHGHGDGLSRGHGGGHERGQDLGHDGGHDDRDRGREHDLGHGGARASHPGAAFGIPEGATGEAVVDAVFGDGVLRAGSGSGTTGVRGIDPELLPYLEAAESTDAVGPDDGAGGWLRDPPHPYADGERLAGLPLHLEAVPQAVGLLLPA